jgi:hypothetical protein
VQDKPHDVPLQAPASSHGMSLPAGNTHVVVAMLLPVELEPWLVVADVLTHYVGGR